MITYHPDCSVCFRGMIVTLPCPKKTDNWVLCEQLLLYLTLLEILIWSPVVYFWTHTRKSMIHHPSQCIEFSQSTEIVVFEHFLRTIDTIFFSAIEKLCGINAKKGFFLTIKCVCKMNVCWSN